MMRTAVVTVAALLLLGSFGCRKAETTATNAPGNTAGSAAADQKAPDSLTAALKEYRASTLDGGEFSLASRKGKVVLLNVWATWCPPCRAEIPELQRIHDANASRGFEVLGVSVDETGVEGVRQFVEEFRMTYPVVLDAEGKIANILDTTVLPTSILIDRKGDVLWKKYGIVEASDPELTRAMAAALAQ